eukprot:UC4_evm2s267
MVGSEMQSGESFAYLHLCRTFPSKNAHGLRNNTEASNCTFNISSQVVKTISDANFTLNITTDAATKKNDGPLCLNISLNFRNTSSPAHASNYVKMESMESRALMDDNDHNDGGENSLFNDVPASYDEGHLSVSCGHARTASSLISGDSGCVDDTSLSTRSDEYDEAVTGKRKKKKNPFDFADQDDLVSDGIAKEKRSSIDLLDNVAKKPMKKAGNFLMPGLIPVSGAESTTADDYADSDDVSLMFTTLETDTETGTETDTTDTENSSSKDDDMNTDIQAGKKLCLRANTIYRGNLIIKESLGKGHSGEVYRAILDDDSRYADVAVKWLIGHPSKKQKKAFYEEASLMTQLKHENIVNLIGIVVPTFPLMIVIQYMPEGNMQTYLRTKGSSLSDSTKNAMALDVCHGMCYLASLKFIHRDLASRNCLVGEELNVKISDFGLTRDLRDSPDEYYRSRSGLVPTSPEGLESAKYTTKSDVWSFGVVLWEIWSNSSLPYGNIDGVKWDNVMVGINVTKGYRLSKPEKCPDSIYEVMRQTWLPEPSNRPHFSELCREKDGILTIAVAQVKARENIKMSMVDEAPTSQEKKHIHS